jgi:hypothetical protein
MNKGTATNTKLSMPPYVLLINIPARPHQLPPHPMSPKNNATPPKENARGCPMKRATMRAPNIRKDKIS